MTPRTSIAGLVAALALVGAPAIAEEPRPEALRNEPPGEERVPWADITARLRAGPDGLSLDVGGRRVELRITGDALAATEPPGTGAPGAQDLSANLSSVDGGLRAAITVNGKTTNLLFRIVPAPADTTAPPEEK